MCSFEMFSSLSMYRQGVVKSKLVGAGACSCPALFGLAETVSKNNWTGGKMNHLGHRSESGVEV
jgi:hypothetical protein